MIYTKKGIEKLIENGQLSVTPINPDNIGTNSIDLTLAKAVYICKIGSGDLEKELLDPKQDLSAFFEYAEIPNEGLVITANRLVLAVTREHTKHLNHVPIMHGVSTLGRMGLFVHITAGFGDVGFAGHWTLELCAVHPIKIYEGMVIGQLSLHAIDTDVEHPYGSVLPISYNNDYNDNPMPCLPNLHLKPHKFQ